MKARKRKLTAFILSAVMVLTGAVPAAGETLKDSSGSIVVASDDETIDAISSGGERVSAVREEGTDCVSGNITDNNQPPLLKDSGFQVMLKGNIEETQCGEFLYYTYNEDTKTFRIYGKGDMWDYGEDADGNRTEHTYSQYFIKNGSFYDGGTGSRYVYDTRGERDVLKEEYDSSPNWFFFRSPWSNDLDIEVLDMTGCPNMTSIGDYAFRAKESLTADVIIPQDVKIIGSCAFEDTAISSVTFNDKLTDIYNYAFMYCKRLSGKLVFPDSIELIGKKAFMGDTALTGSITIPANVKELGEGVFSGDTGLNGELKFGNGSKLETIPKDAFRGCNFTGKLVLPSGIKKIEESAFYANTGFEEVYIPKDIEEIAENAFENCTGIKKVTFGGTAGDWHSNGFDGIKGLNDPDVEVVFEGGDIVTVSFDSMGGSPVDRKEVHYNDLIPVPENPVKTRCEFKGWYTGPGFSGEKWDFSKDTVKGNITLYAAWYQTSCLVSFNSMGGSYVEPQLIGYGEKAERPADPARRGTEFLGWFTDRTFTNEWNFESAVNSDLTLYAKWSGIEYDPGIAYFVIDAVAGYGGEISPEDSVLVPEGAEQKFTITPWEGFYIKSVSVDNIEVGKDTTYTFASVTGDHNITALFSSSNGEMIDDDGRSFYTISANAEEGGSITPYGSVIVNKYANITFSINGSGGKRVSNVMVDGRGIGAVNEKTFKKVRADHSIEASFIENDGEKYCKVEFIAEGADEGIEPMYLKKDSKVPIPMDPVKKGYVFKGWFKDQDCSSPWNFDKDTVTTVAKGTFSKKDEYSTKLYACFIPEDKSKSPICLLSSTGKYGMWVETVIGKGCTQKLYIANSDGKMLDKKSAIKGWDIRPYGDSDPAGIDKFFDKKKLQKGILKCTKKAPLGYTAMVYTTYNGATLRYIVTVVDKVKKMGYTDASGKFRKSITVNLSDNRCDFGYGPQHFLDTENQYIEVYNKNRVKTGDIIYEQPDDSIFGVSVNQLKEQVYYCSARLPEYAGVTTRKETDPATKEKKKLYYFDAYYTGKIRSYKIDYLSPDGSGKKFTVIIKKPK